MKTVLLQHGSGWWIVYDGGGFPSSNYLVFKDESWKVGHKLPPHGVAYCSTLESALASLFQQLIVALTPRLQAEGPARGRGSHILYGDEEIVRRQ